MKTKIKHWLLSGKHNKYHPHILRPFGLLLVLGVLVLIPPAYNITTAQTFQILGYATNISVNGLYQASSKARTDNGLPAYSLNSKLSSAASEKAKDMFADDYWAHVAPDGTEPWSFIASTGYQYITAGENLAKGFYNSSDIIDAWLGSPSHRENTLSAEYKDVGYAVMDGTLLGYKTTLVVAMYGLAYIAPTTSKTTPSQTVTTTSTPTTTTKSTTQTTKPKTVSSAPTTSNKTTSSNSSSTDASGETPDADQGASTSPRGVGEILGSAFSAPIDAYRSLNWGQKLSVLVLCGLILIFILKHTLIWRQKRRGFRHIWLRSHPIGQASLLIAALVITLVSGAGVVL